jgi:hypothetical protein
MLASGRNKKIKKCDGGKKDRGGPGCLMFTYKYLLLKRFHWHKVF